MNNSDLIITISNEVVAEIADNYWVKLEQEGLTPEIPTVSEAVRVIDDLYNIEPCNGTTSGGDPVPVNEDMQPIPPTPEEEFPSVLQRVLSFDACTLAADNSYEVLLRVYRSHNDIPYKLNVTGGEVLQTIRKYEDREDTLLFDNVSTLNIPYPIVGTPVFSWNGTVYGTDDTTPTIKGSTVAFNNPVTGQLQVSYRSRYDLVTIKVFAVEGEQGDCRVFCFYNKTVTVADIKKPSVVDDTFKDIICPSGRTEFTPNTDTVECYQTVRHLVHCKCSGDLERTYETEKIVPCPDGMICPGVTTECRHNMGTVSVTEYTDCGETTDDIADPAFYEQTCCDPPQQGSLPKCSRTTSNYLGGLGIDGGKAHYISLYGDNTRFVAVAPDNGICGRLTIEQVKNQRSCCDGVSPIVWDTDSSVEVMINASSASVYISGGKPPYTWKVRGSGFYASPDLTTRTVTTNNRRLSVYTGDACGTCSIFVTDGCSGDTGTIRSTNGRWSALVNSATGSFYFPVMPGEHYGDGQFNLIPGISSSVSLIISNGIAQGQNVTAFYWHYLHSLFCCISTGDVMNCCDDWRTYVSSDLCATSSGIYSGWDVSGAIGFDLNALDTTGSYTGQDGCAGVKLETRVVIEEAPCTPPTPFLCKTRGATKLYDSRGIRKWAWVC